MGFTVVQWASIMYDLDPRVIGLLKEAGADITEPFKFSSPIMVSCIAAGLNAASKVAGGLDASAASPVRRVEVRPRAFAPRLRDGVPRRAEELSAGGRLFFASEAQHLPGGAGQEARDDHGLRCAL